jgi:hypothetical protein
MVLLVGFRSCESTGQEVGKTISTNECVVEIK